MPIVVESSRMDSLSPVWPHFTQIEVDHANGSYIYDTHDTRYLDFTSGIGVTNTGHCHPRVVQAIQKQAEKLLHGQATIVYHKPMFDLIEELKTVMPEALDCYFFSSSGSEAVESALKLARHATGRPNFIAFQGGYHGRTVGAMAVTTAKTIYRHGYQPLMSGVSISPFPYAYRYDQSPDEFADWCLEELRLLLKTQSAPEETAAMIIEPILGEGGYVVAPHKFIVGLREICDEHGIMLIFDEVQSGFGRTGKFFALEHYGVQPDILVFAKGLASGMPLSGITASREVMNRWMPGSHGGTYGGNALACAAAAETIRILRDENLVENSSALGEYLKQQLMHIQRKTSSIGDVRGLGLMVGCEFTTSEGKPDKLTARKVREQCLENKLILLTCGTFDHVVRWIPPLNVTKQQLDEALEIFLAAVQAANTVE